MKKVLITGMSGLIGGILREHLEGIGGYELTALNRRPVDGVKCYQADISDLKAIKPAFEGQEVVVHLGAWASFGGGWDEILSANLIGTYNVFEAARLAGVKRVVFASSGATVNGWQEEPPYDAIAQGRYDDVPDSWPMITHHQVRPQGMYGASKVWGEALGRHYSDAFGLSILCVRIGSCPRENRPMEPRSFAVHLSHRDCADILRKCIEASEDLRYDVFFATSNNKWGWRDLEHPREVLGFVPQDAAESYR
jgi:nucleoside-diphosphate-sugar epimerase